MIILYLKNVLVIFICLYFLHLVDYLYLSNFILLGTLVDEEYDPLRG